MTSKHNLLTQDQFDIWQRASPGLDPNVDIALYGAAYIWNVPGTNGRTVERWFIPAAWVSMITGGEVRIKHPGKTEEISLPRNEVTIIHGNPSYKSGTQEEEKQKAKERYGPSPLTAVAKWFEVEESIKDSLWKASRQNQRQNPKPDLKARSVGFSVPPDLIDVINAFNREGDDYYEVRLGEKIADVFSAPQNLDHAVAYCTRLQEVTGKRYQVFHGKRLVYPIPMDELPTCKETDDGPTPDHVLRSAAPDVGDGEPPDGDDLHLCDVAEVAPLRGGGDAGSGAGAGLPGCSVGFGGRGVEGAVSAGEGARGRDEMVALQMRQKAQSSTPMLIEVVVNGVRHTFKVSKRLVGKVVISGESVATANQKTGIQEKLRLAKGLKRHETRG